MKNLAGVANASAFIHQELLAAGISEVVHAVPVRGEVPTNITGVLRKDDVEFFTFVRAWYYWSVDGMVPVEIAWEMYNDPNGRNDVRVAGHCGCPPPEDPWVRYYDEDGNQLYPAEQEAEYRRLVKKGIAREDRAIRFVTNPAAEATRTVVESYNIDTAVGLKLFVDTLRKHGLVD